MVGMSDDQILEHFKESFLPRIEPQLLEVDDIDATIVKPRVLLLLFKVRFPQVTSSSMLVYMTN